MQNKILFVLVVILSLISVNIFKTNMCKKKCIHVKFLNDHHLIQFICFKQA